MARKFAVVPVSAAVALVLFSCAARPGLSYESQLAEFMRPYEELKRQKADLWRFGHEPQVFEFEGQGKVTVHRWELAGWPGEVYVKARVTYENTTDTPVEFAFVWLDVLDSQENVAGTTAVRMMNPMGYPFWPGHTFTTELRAPTNGAHLDSNGWSWSVACEAPKDSDPGDKPVLINPDAEFGRMLLTRYSSQPRPVFTPAYPMPAPGPHVPGVTRW